MKVTENFLLSSGHLCKFIPVLVNFSPVLIQLSFSFCPVQAQIKYSSCPVQVQFKSSSCLVLVKFLSRYRLVLAQFFTTSSLVLARTQQSFVLIIIIILKATWQKALYSEITEKSKAKVSGKA